MSLIDALLKADSDKITKKPESTFEVKRLSKALGTKFELKLRAIGAERYTEIQKDAIDLNKKGGVSDVDLYAMQVLTVIDGVVEPSLKDKQLLEHFGAHTAKELVGKLFLSGELSDIASEISKLCGYDKDQSEVDEEVKN